MTFDSLDEMQTARLVIAVVVVLAAAIWLDGVRRRRRERGWFAGLAVAFGSPVVRDSEFLERFATAADDRSFEIRHEYFSSARSGGGGNGWYLISATPLPATWDAHDIRVQPGSFARWFHGLHGLSTVRSGDGAFDQRFSVGEAGVPLHAGWLDAATRRAVHAFFEGGGPGAPLRVEAGHLVHRASAPWRGLDAPAFRDLLARQAKVADALERKTASRTES